MSSAAPGPAPWEEYTEAEADAIAAALVNAAVAASVGALRPAQRTLYEALERRVREVREKCYATAAALVVAREKAGDTGGLAVPWWVEEHAAAFLPDFVTGEMWRPHPNSADLDFGWVGWSVDVPLLDALAGDGVTITARPEGAAADHQGAPPLTFRNTAGPREETTLAGRVDRTEALDPRLLAHGRASTNIPATKYLIEALRSAGTDGIPCVVGLEGSGDEYNLRFVVTGVTVHIGPDGPTVPDGVTGVTGVMRIDT